MKKCLSKSKIPSYSIDRKKVIKTLSNMNIIIPYKVYTSIKTETNINESNISNKKKQKT